MAEGNRIVRIAPPLSVEESELINTLTTEERKIALLEAAKRKVQRMSVDNFPQSIPSQFPIGARVLAPNEEQEPENGTVVQHSCSDNNSRAIDTIFVQFDSHVPGNDPVEIDASCMHFVKRI